MVRLLLQARQRKPPRLDRRGQDGKRIWGRITLQSLQQIGRGFLGSARGGAAAPAEALGALS
jgi:hypothetical protein